MENLAIMQLIYYVKTNRDFDSEIYLFFLNNKSWTWKKYILSTLRISRTLLSQHS